MREVLSVAPQQAPRRATRRGLRPPLVHAAPFARATHLPTAPARTPRGLPHGLEGCVSTSLATAQALRASAADGCTADGLRAQCFAVAEALSQDSLRTTADLPNAAAVAMPYVMRAVNTCRGSCHHMPWNRRHG